MLFVVLALFLKTDQWLGTPVCDKSGAKKTEDKFGPCHSVPAISLKLSPCYGYLGLRVDPGQNRNPSSGPELGDILKFLDGGLCWQAKDGGIRVAKLVPMVDI